MIQIQRIQCGNGNCYVVEENGKAVLVDTARPGHREKILAACRHFDIRLIVLTHTHMDHCQNAAFLSEHLYAPIAICESDAALIRDNMIQPLSARTLPGKLVLFFSIKALRHDTITRFLPDIFLKDGDTLAPYGVNAKIMALPGHTDGSIGIDCGKAGIIVGDALMNMFYPTVSMLYHNQEHMLDSARKISSLGKRTIYFGHGKPCMNREWVK